MATVEHGPAQRSRHSAAVSIVNEEQSADGPGVGAGMKGGYGGGATTPGDGADGEGDRDGEGGKEGEGEGVNTWESIEESNDTPNRTMIEAPSAMSTTSACLPYSLQRWLPAGTILTASCASDSNS